MMSLLRFRQCISTGFASVFSSRYWSRMASSDTVSSSFWDLPGNGFPDGSGFTNVLAGAVVGFFPETDDEANAFIEEFDHLPRLMAESGLLSRMPP